MGKIVKGDVIVLPFPFSDLSNSKRRPAVVIAALEGEDIILCQVTSQERFDSYSIPLAISDFKEGSLPVDSFIRPNRLFTADQKIILYKAGSLKNLKMDEVDEKIIQIIRGRRN